MRQLTYPCDRAQVHWLAEHAAARALRDEVEAGSDRVWNFIIEREIEAPDRFRAIQSYRCATDADFVCIVLALASIV